jgi:hypothetical protein
MINGSNRHHWHARRLLLACLLASTAEPALASNDSASTDSATQTFPEEQRQEILVIGQSLFRDIEPEANLDRDAIDSYGASTVDELLGEVQAELGEDEAPLILVNGERVGGLEDIGGFPVEALRNLQVLPRGSAVRMGGTTGQRVINLTLQRKMRAATLTAAEKLSTEGEWHGERGEALFTYIQGATRANVSLRARRESSLLESERGIIQPDPDRPFALQGNVVGFPDSSGEIDPLLSALAGEIVTVAPVLGISNPTLADFADVANQQNTTDLGDFRTLKPRLRNYDLNGTFATRLAPWLTTNATLRLSRNATRSLRGLPSALFVLPADNPFSPFSREVGLAVYGRDPLLSRYTRNSGEGRITFNGRFGQWIGTLNTSHSETKDVIDTDRRATFGFIPIDAGVDPFTTDLSDLIDIRTDRATSRTRSDIGQLSFTGPLVALPAGPLQATIEGRLSWYSLRSHNTFVGSTGRDFHRNERGFRTAVEIPLTSRDSGVLPQIGTLTGTAEYGRIHYSDAGSLDRWAVGLTWEPIDLLQLRGSIEERSTPPSIQVLGDPVIATPEVRVFDPLTGETVDVTQVTGGNPSLRPEKLRVSRLASTVRLLPRYNLQLNAEYTDTDARNYISSLPPASAAVMLAFPDRFIRNADGTLTRVDLRPVNFDSHREKRVRWGLSMRAKLAGGRSLGDAPPAESESSEESAPAPQLESQVRQLGRPSTYLQLSANHTVVFSDKIRIRPGLDSVDLLGGGALGIGGGRVRHQIDGTAALTSGGRGARRGVTWRGASKLDTRIAGVSDTLRFSPLLLVNLRLFADARRFLPDAGWAKGLRISLDAVNLLNDRQKVRDSFGNTPLQYQPAYRDPLGRTIEFEIRKVF